jgi:hypothetical protein
MNKRTFIRMKDHAAIVRLATRLGYKVYKENVDYDSDQPALYIVKNKDGVKVTGAILNAILARIIKYDMQKSHVSSNIQENSLSVRSLV